MVGSNAAWMSVRAQTIAEGRFIAPSDVEQRAAVTVLASETSEELFGFRDPVGQTVNIDGVPFTVIGVLAPAGASSTTDEDDQAIVPITTAADRLFGGTTRNEVQEILLEATGGSTLSAAYQEADAELLSLHGITTPADADFTITTEQQIVSTATSVDKTLTVLLGGIAGISLARGRHRGHEHHARVGHRERIREIGLRKALGAAPRIILRQFLVEASVLGLVGGVLGVGLGIIGADVLPHFISDPIAISSAAVAGSILIAIAIGLVFGVYPAGRAARLAPIDALRTE